MLKLYRLQTLQCVWNVTILFFCVLVINLETAQHWPKLLYSFFPCIFRLAYYSLSYQKLTSQNKFRTLETTAMTKNYYLIESDAYIRHPDKVECNVSLAEWKCAIRQRKLTIGSQNICKLIRTFAKIQSVCIILVWKSTFMKEIKRSKMKLPLRKVEFLRFEH